MSRKSCNLLLATKHNRVDSLKTDFLSEIKLASLKGYRMKPRYYDEREAEKLGIQPGWYPVDENGNRLTDTPFGSKESVEEWIEQNSPPSPPPPPPGM